MTKFSSLPLAFTLFLVSLALGCAGAAGSSGTSLQSNATGGSPTATPTPTPTPTPSGAADITQVNHVVIMLQENRSFDHYFGQMTAYRQVAGIPIVSSNSDGIIEDLSRASFSNSGVAPTHSGSVCMENMSPDWAEDRHEVNLQDPAGVIPGNTSTEPMDGFVNTAAGIASYYSFVDTAGNRAMHYYNEHELNYYYFMASNFAMDDHFYSPVPTNTPNSRIFLFGATSQGTVHTPGGSEACPGETVQMVPEHNASLPNAGKPIFQLLSENNLTWKIYITDLEPTCEPNNGTFPLDCAVKSTYLQFFSYIDTATPGAINPAVLQHLAPIDCTNGLNVLPAVPAHPAYTCPAGVTDYFTDVQNGNLPNVAFIETGGFSGRDEHPSGRDLGSNTVTCAGVSPLTGQTCINIEVGATFVSTVMNKFMNSPSWKDSVFFWMMDEGGGAFDHVPPMQVPNPDGIKPILCPLGTNNAITGFTITSGGTGYTSAPSVTITDPTGTGATATAVVTGGVVIGITAVTPGSNYTAPTVLLSGGGGTGATATAGTSGLPDPKDVNVGCDFTITGFRIPNMVVSPFSRQNYVSHTPMDYTAVLKFIETRWKLPNLTLRDASMPDMTEFFDFANKPWATPPANVPKQNINNAPCDFALE